MSPILKLLIILLEDSDKCSDKSVGMAAEMKTGLKYTSSLLPSQVQILLCLTSVQIPQL
jgi:hypothetical protein